jgi:hypothetical protein
MWQGLLVIAIVTDGRMSAGMSSEMNEILICF